LAKGRDGVQAALDSIHLAIDIATPLVLIAVSWVGLLIKSNLADIKTAQELAKAELKEEFNAKHAENTQTIAVHSAVDEQKFTGIQSTLNRLEQTLRRLESSTNGKMEELLKLTAKSARAEGKLEGSK
jgi:hypothetical protein